MTCTGTLHTKKIWCRARAKFYVTMTSRRTQRARLIHTIAARKYLRPVLTRRVALHRVVFVAAEKKTGSDDHMAECEKGKQAATGAPSRDSTLRRSRALALARSGARALWRGATCGLITRGSRRAGQHAYVTACLCDSMHECYSVHVTACMQDSMHMCSARPPYGRPLARALGSMGPGARSLVR